MNESEHYPDQVEVEQYYANYSWWGCPRCSSEEIGEHTEPEVIDGVEYGFRHYWLCHRCGHRFSEPTQYAGG